MKNVRIDEGSHNAPVRILHVEDNEADASNVSAMLGALEDPAMERVGAASLLECRSRLESGRIDLILLDLNLPDSSGLDTLRALKPGDGRTPPIVVLCDEGDRHAGLLAIKEGAQDYLPKTALSREVLGRAILGALTRDGRVKEASRKRRRAEEYLDIAPVIFIAHDAGGRIVWINRAGCEILGECGEHILGSSWLERFAQKRDRPEARRVLDMVLRGNEAGRARTELFTTGRDGAEQLISWLHSPLRGASGKIEGILSSGLDVTAKRGDEKRILILSRLTEANPNPLLRLGADGRIDYANPASAMFLTVCGLSPGDRAPAPLLEAAERARGGGETPEIDFRAEDKVFRFLLAEAYDGGLVNAYGRDVTESENALRRLTMSEEIHRAIFESSPLGMIHSDANGVVTRCNSRFLEIMGTTQDMIIGFNAITGLQNQDLRNAVSKAIAGEPAGYDGPYSSVTGTRSLYLRAHFSPVRAGDPPNEIIGVFEDYTESRRAEERLRLIKQRLELALEASGIGMWDWFVQTGLYDFDERWSRMIGYEKNELERTADAWRSRIHPDDAIAVEKLLQALFAGKQNAYQAEYRLRTKSGAWKWALALGRVMERDGEGRPVRMTGIHLDIDDHMRLMEERDWNTRVKETLSRLYRRLTVSAPDMGEASMALLEEARGLVRAEYGFCAIVTETGDIMVKAVAGALDEACALGGEKVLMSKRVSDGSYPGLLGHALNSGQGFFTNAPASHPASKGFPQGHIPIRAFLAVPAILGNQPVGLIVLANKDGGFTARDLSAIKEMGRYYAVAIQRVEALKELSDSEERYRTLVETMQEGIVMIDEEGRLTYVNHQFRKMLGLSRQDMLGGHISNLADESRRSDYEEQLAKRKRGSSEKYEMVFRHAQGHKVFTLISPTPLFDEDGRYKGSFGVVTNVTQLKLLESQLVQAQKLESIGQLAAGIAHEINTPTQYVDNNVRYLRDGVDKLLEAARAGEKALAVLDSLLSGENAPKGDAGARAVDAAEFLRDRLADADIEYLAEEMPGALDDSLDGLSRIAEIVRSVKQLAHPGKPEMELVDINEAVKSTVVVSRNEWKYAADLETDFDENLPLVRCIRGEFNQVILNLIVNAAQAIQEKVGRSPGEKGKITVSTKRGDGGVEIRVADTGPGIPERIRDKIFDPFFTTKEVGKGTGQGLAISYNVIHEKHGGRLTFETEEGRGATFIVWLPFKDDDAVGGLEEEFDAFPVDGGEA